MYCEKCGSQYRPGTEVCFNCGSELTAPIEPTMSRSASRGLLMAGWVFSLLGSLVGLIISTYIAGAKIKTSDGKFVYKYDEPSRRQGRTMLTICVIVIAMSLIVLLFFPPQS